MKKVLYVGYYKENSAWGRLSENLIRSLIAAGADVTARPILLGEQRSISPEIEVLEAKPIEECDVLVQHVFPEHMVGNNIFERNVALIGGDTGQEDVKTPMSQIVFADDYIAIERPNYQSLKPLQVPNTEDTFKCVIIDDAKNRQATFDAVFEFHSTFETYEKASLTIFSQNPEGLEELCTQAKLKVGKRQDVNSYTQDIIVPLPAGESYPEAYFYADCVMAFPQCSLMYAEILCYTNKGCAKEHYESWLNNPISYQSEKIKSAIHSANYYNFERQGKNLRSILDV